MYFEFPGTHTRLMGSLHAFPPGVTQMPDWARSAYDWCEVLVIESDPATLFPLTKAASPNGLRTALSPACWAYLSGIWQANALFAPLEQVAPWAVLMFASVFVLQLGPGIEGPFMAWANADRKTIQALESAHEIVATLEAAPFEDVCRAIEMLPLELPFAQQKLDAIYLAWADRDLVALETAAASSMLQIPSLRAALLTTRNQAWGAKIRAAAAIHAQQRTLIVVGALHLLEPDGLLSHIGHEAVVLG